MYTSYIILTLFVDFVITYEVIPLSSDVWDHAYDPYWDEDKQCLYFIDFLSTTRAINRYDMRKNRIYSAKLEGNVATSFLIPLKNRPNYFASGIERTVEVLKWNGKDHIATISKSLFSVEQSKKYDKNLWNIAKASPLHKFFGGTYRTEICSLSSSANASFYSYSDKFGVERLLENVKVSSGLDWNVKEKKFYHVDSCNGIIREFHYDPKTLELCNERIAFQFRGFRPGKIPSYVPLGLTIDTEGFLWVALYHGGAVWKIDPDKSKVVQKIKLPAKIITTLTFGGPKLDILFVMSGSKAFDLGTGDILTNLHGGQIFMIKGLGARGFPGRKLNIKHKFDSD